MVIRKEIDLSKPLTDEQKKMLEELKTRLVHPDEDRPELTEEQLSQMVRLSATAQKRTTNNQQPTTNN